MDEEARIFSKNLNALIAESGKTQKEVAQAIGFNPTTFNTWCVGKIFPKSGKIQRIADYFGVPKSVLTEEPIDPKDVVMPVPTPEEYKILMAYRRASTDRKEAVRLLLGVTP